MTLSTRLSDTEDALSCAHAKSYSQVSGVVIAYIQYCAVLSVEHH